MISTVITVLSFAVIGCSVTLLSTELLWRWSPLALRFKWSLAWEITRLGGWVCAVGIAGHKLL